MAYVRKLIARNNSIQGLIQDFWLGGGGAENNMLELSVRRV